VSKKKKTSASRSKSAAKPVEGQESAMPSNEGIRAARRIAEAKARELAVRTAAIADADKCSDVVVLDLRGLSPICDYYVIATGTSDRQMRAVSDNIEEMGRGLGEKPFRVTGRNEGTWIVVDYVDVVVHLFDAEHRRYYDLELLWGDAPKVDWASEQGSAEPAA